jgi:hypothetical protein
MRRPGLALWRLQVGLAVGLAVAVSSFSSSGVASGAVPGLPDVLVSTWVPDGSVDALLSSGDTIYVGGSFSRWTAPTGSAAVVDRGAGVMDTSWPIVAGGRVVAVAADGHGGWYVGGGFSFVGGDAHQGLAHVRADHTVDPDWAPGRLDAISGLYVAGGRVYVAGGSANNEPSVRPYLVALDPVQGRLLSWRPRLNGSVDALVARGSTIVIGGDFTRVGGKPRAGLAALDSRTGAVLGWNPRPRCIPVGCDVHPDGTPYVSALALSGSTLFVGGFFDGIGGARRSHAAAVNSQTGRVLPWNPRLRLNGHTGQVSAIAAAASRVVIAFDRSQKAVVVVDPLHGRAIEPAVAIRPFGSVEALATSSTTIYIAGFFDRVAGKLRRNAAAIDIRTGRVTNWNPDPRGDVLALATTRHSVFLGGAFGGVKGVTRTGIAAINAVTGALLPWHPAVNGDVSALVSDGQRLYVGGSFTRIEGEPRLRLASFDLASGVLTGWRPTVRGGLFGVKALAVAGGTVFVGGDFGSVNGDSKRVNLAAIDALSGVLRPWTLATDDSVYALATGGGAVYVAGPFHRVGAERRTHLAKIDPADGRIIDWSPPSDPRVPATVTLSGSTVYVGGFDSYLMALDAQTGAREQWAPRPEQGGEIATLAARGGILLVGGDFQEFDAVAQPVIAAVDAINGNLLSWNPHLAGEVLGFGFGTVDAIALAEPFVALGGDFMGAAGAPRAGFVLFRSGSVVSKTRTEDPTSTGHFMRR